MNFLRGKLSVKHYLQLASIAPAVSFCLNPTWSHHVIRRKFFLTWEESILCFEDQQQTWVLLVCLSYWVCGDKQ